MKNEYASLMWHILATSRSPRVCLGHCDNFSIDVIIRYGFVICFSRPVLDRILFLEFKLHPPMSHVGSSIRLYYILTLLLLIHFLGCPSRNGIYTNSVVRLVNNNGVLDVWGLHLMWTFSIEDIALNKIILKCVFITYRKWHGLSKKNIIIQQHYNFNVPVQFFITCMFTIDKLTHLILYQ